MPSFGGRIAAARKRRGWKQTDLAEKSGVSYATIKAWERKEDPPVGSPYLRRVEHVLGISFDDLRDDLEPADIPAGWDLTKVPEAVIVAELSRRVALRAARERHDQSNVEPIAVQGIVFEGDAGDGEEVEGETGPA